VIETNMLALLPVGERDPVLAQAATRFDATAARRHLVLVGAATLPAARAAASQLERELLASDAFAEVLLRVDAAQQAEMAALYAPYRQRLLSDAMREQLRSGGAAAAVQQATRTLYGAMAPVSSQLLATDPLLLFYDFVAVQGGGRGNVTLQGDMLAAEYKGRHYVLLQLQLRADPFAVAVQEQVVPALENGFAAVRAADPAVELLDIGAVRFAAAGVDSARSEVNTIGLGSTIAVVVVLLVVFRSPLPMFASLLAGAVGFTLALAACWASFGSIHLLTLVFGSSLLGISIDHCLHFFADRLAAGPDWRADTGLQRIFPGITIGLITTIIGYAGLYLTGFPGMQQMAVFSCAGLAGAYFTVIWFYPAWIKQPAGAARGPWLRYSGELLHRLRPRNRRWFWVLLPVLALIAVPGLLRVHTDDDIRALQPVSKPLRAVEQQIRAITGMQGGTQYFLVEGDSPAAVLASEETLTKELRALVDKGHLAGYAAISRQLPSPRRQDENLQLIQSALADRATLQAYADQIGLEPKVLDDYRLAVAASAGGGDLGLQHWLDSPAGSALQHQWVGRTARGYAALVPLYGIVDMAPLRALAGQQAQWHYVDKAADMSDLFKRYRERATLLIVVAYCFVYVFLAWRYGPLLGLAVMLPTALAATLTIAGLAWLGYALNLFHLLALLLVLGIGIDYSLFLLEDDELSPACMLAILLSAVANELSFGMLTVSETPAVRAFGLTVLIGVAGAALLAPLIVDMNKALKR
jgi:predicted exporter